MRGGRRGRRGGGEEGMRGENEKRGALKGEGRRM